VELHQARRYLGRTDTGLDDLGRDQARWWAGRLAGREFAGVWSSGLARSREFAGLVAGPGTVRPLSALREIDLGEWDGRAMDEVRQSDPAGFEARGLDLAGFRPPGGESFADLQARVVPAVEALLAAGGTHLVVGHQGVNRALLCHVLGLPLGRLLRLRQDYACLNRITLHKDGWRLQLLNASPDLFGGP
jgi:probable phosphoglycerate mutase